MNRNSQFNINKIKNIQNELHELNQKYHEELLIIDGIRIDIVSKEAELVKHSSELHRQEIKDRFKRKSDELKNKIHLVNSDS